jgi:hypothetical protein
MSRSSAEKPAGESDHVECCHPSGRCVSRAGALREAAGVVSGTPGCDPESFILSFGQSGLRPRRPGAFGQNL